MIRAPVGDAAYWDEWVAYGKERIAKEQAILRQPSANPAYMPQYAFDLSIGVGRYMLKRYCRGDDVKEIATSFPDLLDAWEISNRLSDDVCGKEEVSTCRDWDFLLTNLNHYNWCFWLVGLALALDVPEDQWLRLLALIGDDGEDVLLDRVIASRQSSWKIGGALIHEKPYRRLQRAVDAEREEQADLLFDFVAHWYDELKRPSPRNSKAPTKEPFWYAYGDATLMPIEKGSYFGRWCIEAVAAVKAFGLDDSKCVGHQHYPGDLLRADAPNNGAASEIGSVSRVSILSRLFGFRK
ncbi:PoNe immunity protein domain-containing protein [Mitsuaria sp. GD03876]|uniref:PoNe immunity protein domain-containing protein n=1 Tax=Mitsuaria sp. GD03876 TaxID=2975399 RepID=UPI00244BC26F|nr:PoNe immunity protein domain-containing protein [Mitsuaria sp. GD03876]MDH0864652.1 PoNi-like cognate immunity protein [Mitsuaria sp. GD03876]